MYPGPFFIPRGQKTRLYFSKVSSRTGKIICLVCFNFFSSTWFIRWTNCVLLLQSSIILVRGWSSEVRDWVVSAAVKVKLLPGFSRLMSSKKRKSLSLPVFQRTFFLTWKALFPGLRHQFRQKKIRSFDHINFLRGKENNMIFMDLDIWFLNKFISEKIFID